MIIKGTLLKSGFKAEQKWYPGPGRECCFQFFSLVRSNTKKHYIEAIKYLYYRLPLHCFPTRSRVCHLGQIKSMNVHPSLTCPLNMFAFTQKEKGFLHTTDVFLQLIHLWSLIPFPSRVVSAPRHSVLPFPSFLYWLTCS